MSEQEKTLLIALDEKFTQLPETLLRAASAPGGSATACRRMYHREERR